jgi:hypothetical protein
MMRYDTAKNKKNEQIRRSIEKNIISLHIHAGRPHRQTNNRRVTKQAKTVLKQHGST